jgi:hypothetical protein
MDIVSFLKYLIERGIGKRVDGLLDEFLKEKDLNARLSQITGVELIQFLQFLNERKLEAESRGLLGAMLKDKNFLVRLSRTTAVEVIKFLRYLDKQGIESERKMLLDFILESGKFPGNLPSLQPSDMSNVLPYLSEIGYKEAAQKLLDKVYGSLEQPEFEEYLKLWSAYNVSGLMAAVRDSGLSLPSALWQTLIRISHGASYREPVPDPAFPQAKLLRMSMVDLVTLLRQNSVSGKRYKLNCLRLSLISDEEKLKKWIGGLSPQNAAFFRKTLEQLQICIPSGAQKLLDEPNRRNDN